MESSFKRSERLAELILHEVAGLITNELKDPRIGFVTVTEVRVTNDLKLARVYVSILGDAAIRQESLNGLEAAAGFLRKALGKALQVRYTPNLAFFLDESLDHADRMQTLMNAIAHGEHEVPEVVPEGFPVEAQTFRSSLADLQRELEASQPLPPKKKDRTTKRRGRH